MRCPYCHHLLNRTASYCPHCGKPVAQNSCSSEQIDLKSKSIPIRWVVLFVLLILLLIGGLSFFLFRQKTPLSPSLDTYTEINQKLSSIEEPYLDEEGFVSSEDSKILLEEVFAYIQTLYEQDLITDCSYTDGDTAVYYQIDNWLGCLYFPQIKDMLSGASGDVQIVTIEPYHSDLDMWLNSKLTGPYINSFVPRDRLGLYYDRTFLDTDGVAEKLKQFSDHFIYEQDYHNESVDIDLLYTLDFRNSVVIWQGHGGDLEKYGSLLSINAKKWDQSDIEAHKQEFSDDSLLLCPNDVIAITSKFFEQHLPENAMENSLIYLNTCASLKDYVNTTDQTSSSLLRLRDQTKCTQGSNGTPKSLACALLNAGAKCVIGNSDSVLIIYAYAMQDTIFDALQDVGTAGIRNSVSQSIIYAQELCKPASNGAAVMAVGTDITLDDLLTPSVKDNDSSLSAPLSAADVNWIVEPTYDYDDVEPIYSYLFDHYTGEPLQDDRYSIYNNYYAITRGDSYSLYEMETQTEYSDWQTGLVNEFGYPTILTYETKESKINLYPVGSTPSISPPWEGVGSSIPHGTTCGAIVYDPEKQSFLYVRVSEMDETIFEEQDLTQGSWSKPYPVIECTSESVSYADPPYQTYHVASYENYYQTDDDILFAYVSPDGTLLTNYQFDNATGFSDGLAACSENGKWGYVDKSGNKVTDFIYDPLLPVGASTTMDGGERQYNIVRYGYPCTCDTMVVCKDGEIGLLYRDGTTLLDFGEFEDLAPAYNDQLWAKQNGLWGLIDLAALKEKANLSA